MTTFASVATFGGGQLAIAVRAHQPEIITGGDERVTVDVIENESKKLSVPFRRQATNGT
jgi:hypothetical protein